MYVIFLGRKIMKTSLSNFYVYVYIDVTVNSSFFRLK